MAEEPEARIERRGRAGFIVLDRPRALNALTLTMVRAISRALDDFERDPAIARVVVAAGGRAFCAGGDIRKLYEQGRAGDHAAQLTFWREEYILDRTHQAVFEALCRIDRRDRHGRRGRARDARFASRGERAMRIRDAGGRHRFLSRCRGDLVVATAPPSDRRLSGADGPARRSGRPRRAGARDLRSRRAARSRPWSRPWRAKARWRRYFRASARRRRPRR